MAGAFWLTHHMQLNGQTHRAAEPQRGEHTQQLVAESGMQWRPGVTLEC
jgi:hypothetical protein